MNCKNCGSLINDGDLFCKSCGARVERIENMSTQNTPTLNTQNMQPLNTPVIPVQPSYNVNVEQPTMQPTQNFNTLGGNSYQSSNNYQSNNNMNSYAKKDSNSSNIVGGIIGIIIVIALLFGGYYLFKDKLFKNDTISTTATYTIKLQGFEFKIPSDYIYEEGDKSFTLYDSTQTWAAKVEIISGSFTKLKTNREQAKSSIEKNGFTVNNMDVKTIKDNQYLTLEVSSGGDAVIIAYSQLNPTNIIAITAYNNLGTINYTIIENVTPIIKGATFVGESTSIKTDFNIDSSVITEFAQ